MEENRTEELVVEEAPVVQEAPVETTPAQEPAEQTAEGAKFDMDAVKEMAKKVWDTVKSFAKKVWETKLYKMIALGVAAAILLACVLGIVAGVTGPKAVAKKAVTAMSNGDMGKVYKMYAYDYYAYMLGEDGDEDEFFERYSEMMDEDIESWKDYEKAVKEAAQEALEDEYGKYKISKEVTKVKDVSKKSLKNDNESLLEELEEVLDFDVDDIKDIKAVTVKVKIDGEDGKDTDKITVYVVKMGMFNWKVFNFG